MEQLQLYTNTTTYTIKDIFWVVARLLQPRIIGCGNRCQVCELNRVKSVVSNTVNPSLDPFNI